VYVLSIDWDLNRKVWNKDHHTNYKTRYEFIAGVYKKHPTSLKSGDAIKISSTSFLRAMIEEDIPRLPKGHRFPSQAQKTVLEMDTADMYRWQVALQAKITMQHAWILLTRFNKKWKKLRN